MTDRLDLPRRYREELEALLRKHVPDAKVWAHGSRVNGRSHDGSDLDLVLRSTTLEPLGYEYVELVEALEQSSGPGPSPGLGRAAGELSTRDRAGLRGSAERYRDRPNGRTLGVAQRAIGRNYDPHAE